MLLSVHPFTPRFQCWRRILLSAKSCEIKVEFCRTIVGRSINIEIGARGAEPTIAMQLSRSTFISPTPESTIHAFLANRNNLRHVEIHVFWLAPGVYSHLFGARLWFLVVGCPFGTARSRLLGVGFGSLCSSEGRVPR